MNLIEPLILCGANPKPKNLDYDLLEVLSSYDSRNEEIKRKSEKGLEIFRKYGVFNIVEDVEDIMEDSMMESF